METPEGAVVNIQLQARKHRCRGPGDFPGGTRGWGRGQRDSESGSTEAMCYSVAPASHLHYPCSWGPLLRRHSMELNISLVHGVYTGTGEWGQEKRLVSVSLLKPEQTLKPWWGRKEVAVHTPGRTQLLKGDKTVGEAARSPCYQDYFSTPRLVDATFKT